MTAGFGRTAREEAEYRKIVWPDSDVYRNRLGIEDATELEVAERFLVGLRVEAGFPANATPYSYAGFRAMHRHMFQDIYDWAGEERAYTSGRGPVPFAAPEHVTGWMEKQFETLKARRFHMSRSPGVFVSEAAILVNEINAAHPFIDGNGRTQRQWLRALARDMGYRLMLRSEDRDRWNEASKIGFERSDHTAMADLLDARIEPLKRPYDRGR